MGLQMIIRPWINELIYRRERKGGAKVRKEEIPFALPFASLAPSRIKFGTGFADKLRR